MEPAGRWTMGLLKPEDWQAQWIGFDGDAGAEDAADEAAARAADLPGQPLDLDRRGQGRAISRPARRIFAR